MGAPVVHFEINGPNGEAEAKFYSELFGWHTESFPEMGYTLVDTHAGGGIGGGIGAGGGDATTSVVYVEVPDLQATLDKAQSLGGRTVTPPTDIPNVVSFAQFADPAGNVVGLVKGDGSEQAGVSEGGNPQVGWFEIYGKEAQPLWAFYRELFGWEISESSGDGHVYGEVKTGAERGINGGISGSDGGSRVTLWAHVDDIPKYLERASSLGATKMMDPQPVNEHLTVALFSDPQGMPFGLFTYGH